MTSTYYCDTCNADLSPHLHTQDLTDGIVRHYIMCYACGSKFTAYYTNPEIRQMQGEIRELQERLKKSGKQKLAVRHDKLKRRIQAKMVELREQIERG